MVPWMTAEAVALANNTTSIVGLEWTVTESFLLTGKIQADERQNASVTSNSLENRKLLWVSQEKVQDGVQR